VQAFTDWLAHLIDYLPTLIAGVLIIAAGYIVSRFVADLLLATATRLAHTQRLALARVAQVLILVGAILVGADQVGIKITFLAIFAAGAAATIVGGVALAVGFGARDYIANLIGAHYMRQAFPVGQFCWGEYEGRGVRDEGRGKREKSKAGLKSRRKVEGLKEARGFPTFTFHLSLFIFSM
jgi:hypothetical protein